eukprot:TRINITY_DN10709_c0_g1_i4.p1 TRINITY_DN10709_c0_g1~~TRINITY_DN10709_c0_g1_i4.p1  ORF type:complete len:206 (-),score=30.48 TRINITY_DN10709_c0_g1_i4:226-843(-)
MNFFQGSSQHKFLCLKDYSDANLKPCFACGAQILSPFDSVLFSGQMYHKQCFVCNQCSKTAGYLDASGRKLCKNHYEKEVLKKCLACNSQVRLDSDFMFMSGRGSLHKSCAVCSTCQALLTNETLRFSKTKGDSQLVCSSCFAEEVGNIKCHVCEQAITKGSVMTVQKVTFHKDCLKCQVCQVDLVGQKMMVIKNKPRCIKHLRP